MGDKCAAHDSCMGEIRSELGEIKDMLRDGRVVHKEHSFRIQHLERAQGGWNWKGNLLRLGFSLLEKAVLVIVALAAWSVMNGGLKG